MRSRHLAYQTEKSYLHWIRRYIRHHKKQHPAELSENEVIQFLNYVANDRNCSPSTQSQALSALRAPAWQYIFPAARLCAIPDTGEVVRYHRHPDNIRKAITAARERSGLTRHITCHTFRHSFATLLVQGGADIRTVQDQLGHADVKTTEIYTHVIKRGAGGVISPLDKL